jgi:hypothetical protein
MLGDKAVDPVHFGATAEVDAVEGLGQIAGKADHTALGIQHLAV